MSNKQIFLITGCSQGIGLALTRYIQSQNHIVIASSRSPSKTPDLVHEIESKGGKWIQLDVTSPAVEIKETISKAEGLYGRIDVLVNNAGYAVMGAVEDTDGEDAVRQMQVNFYGPLEVIKAVLPGMRERKRGVIVNVSSAQGMCPSPANGVYAASKAALEAISESLSQEIADFGIRVLVVEPGAFRTEFGNSQATVVESSAPYKDPENVVAKRLELVRRYAGSAKGDPMKAARVIYDKVMDEEWLDLRLIIGPDCWKRVGEKVDVLRRTVDGQRAVAASTDFDT